MITTILALLLAIAALFLGATSILTIGAGGLASVVAVGHLIESMVLFALVLVISLLQSILSEVTRGCDNELLFAERFQQLIFTQQQISQQHQQTVADIHKLLHGQREVNAVTMDGIAKLLTEQAQYLSDIASKD